MFCLFLFCLKASSQPSSITSSLITSTPFTCAPADFECLYQDKCIPHGSVCDKLYDCNQGDDEFNCTSR